MTNLRDECWASSIGGCGGGISREHYVSECLFPNQTIFVQGLDWCIENPKPIRIETLTAKILCKDHNAALSSLDAAAGKAFSAIRDYVSTTNQRAEMPYFNWAFKQFQIDGSQLERWLLKTLLNFSFKRSLIIGPGTHSPGIVPLDLARIAFSLDDFSNGRGLYTAFRQSETFILEPRIGYVAKAQGQNLAMGYFTFYGYRFYLNLFPNSTQLSRIEDSEVFYRRAHFAHTLPNGRITHRLSIESPA